MEHRDKITNALWHGFPNARWVCADTYATLDWMSDDIPKPTEQEFNDAITAWEVEYDAQEYARNRQAEFPSIPDQLDEIYHNGIDSWKAVIKVTKDKYPKG